MTTTKLIAKHLRDVHFGGNWTVSNLESQLNDISWQEATTTVHNLNTIATLAFHINYYVAAVSKVLQGHPLEAKDELSFNHPPINSEKDWSTLKNKLWEDAERFAQDIEQLPDAILFENFTDPKYGNYYRNLNGIIEHMHYHLGQIALLKKIIKSN